jgi:Mce-associated membrane protein
VSENKHESDETVEDTSARVEPETASGTTTERPRKPGAQEPDAESIESGEPPESDEPRDWSRVVAFGVLPALAFVLAVGAAYLKFVDLGLRESNTAREQSIVAAKDTTVAMLSYKPETVEQQLTDARTRLTEPFLDEYTKLIQNVVIPGAKEKKISAVASVPTLDNVPAAAAVSANPGRAVVLLFLNQTVTIGAGIPADTASSVRVTLDKVGERWLISQFEPV